MANAIREYIREALAQELRTRDAEQRAHLAETKAAAAESRLARLERDAHQLRMNKYVARHLLRCMIPVLASGNIEAAVGGLCHTIDDTLTDEGSDGWRVEILLRSWAAEQSMTVYVYWSILVFKKLVGLRFNTPADQLCIMHAGMELDDIRTLRDYDLYDRSHLPGLPIFFVSRRGP